MGHRLVAALGCMLIAGCVMAAPARAAGSAMLQVRTHPSRAMVTVQGLDESFSASVSSPSTLRPIRPGRYSVRVEKPGYCTAAQNIEVPAGGSSRLNIRLRRAGKGLSDDERERRKEALISRLSPVRKVMLASALATRFLMQPPQSEGGVHHDPVSGYYYRVAPPTSESGATTYRFDLSLDLHGILPGGSGSITASDRDPRSMTGAFLILTGAASGVELSLEGALTDEGLYAMSFRGSLDQRFDCEASLVLNPSTWTAASGSVAWSDGGGNERAEIRRTSEGLGAEGLTAGGDECYRIRFNGAGGAVAQLQRRKGMAILAQADVRYDGAGTLFFPDGTFERIRSR